MGSNSTRKSTVCQFYLTFLDLCWLIFSTTHTSSNYLVSELQGSIQLLQYYRINLFKSDLLLQETAITKNEK